MTTSKKPSKGTKKRLPRPQGLTEIMYQYHHTSKTTQKQQLKEQRNNLLIKQYINNKQNLNGVPMTTQQVAHLLDIEHKELLKQMYNNTVDLYGFLDDENDSKDTIKALLGALFLGLNEDRNAIHNQLVNLATSQPLGQGYKPYISAEYNKTLDLLLKSERNFLELLRTISPSQGQGTLIQILNQTTQTEQAPDILHPSQAIKLIREQGAQKPINDPSHLLQLKDQYDLDNLPEVSVKGDMSDATMSLDPEAIAEKFESHDDRRENELGIDVEADEI